MSEFKRIAPEQAASVRQRAFVQYEEAAQPRPPLIAMRIWLVP